MISLRLLFAAALLASAGSAAAQTRYTYDPSQGGLVDNVADANGDHLIWSAGAGLSWIGRTNYNYYGAVDYLPGQYAQTTYGAGYVDWRCPTPEELEAAAAAGVYSALVEAAAADEVGAPNTVLYWSTGPAKKVQGTLCAPAYSLADGGWLYAGMEGSSINAILVRGAAPPAPAPTKPGKRK